MQIEKRHITEVGLGADVANEQDLRHRIEVDEKVVSLFVPLFEPFEEIDL